VSRVRQTRRMGPNPMSGVQGEVRSVVFNRGAGRTGYLVGGLGSCSVALIRQPSTATITARPTPKSRKEFSYLKLFPPASAKE
jgi:hypothetical protein